MSLYSATVSPVGFNGGGNISLLNISTNSAANEYSLGLDIQYFLWVSNYNIMLQV